MIMNTTTTSTVGRSPSPRFDRRDDAPLTDVDRQEAAARRQVSAGMSPSAVQSVLDVACVRHNFPPAVPCCDIDSETGSLRLALCGSRIQAAGFRGAITPRADPTPLRPRNPSITSPTTDRTPSMPGTRDIAVATPPHPPSSRASASSAAMSHPTRTPGPPGPSNGPQSREIERGLRWPPAPSRTAREM